LAFFQSFEAFALNSREMNEYIVLSFNFDESETFFRVKPFYFTFLKQTSKTKTLTKLSS